MKNAKQRVAACRKAIEAFRDVEAEDQAEMLATMHIWLESTGPHYGSAAKRLVANIQRGDAEAAAEREANAAEMSGYEGAERAAHDHDEHPYR